MTALRENIANAVRSYIAERLTALGKPAAALAASTDLFEDGVLDSVALAGLIAAVEQAAGCEIDFVNVDPDALGTVDSIIGQLTRAAEAR